MSSDIVIVALVLAVIFGVGAVVRMVIAAVHTVTERACTSCQGRMSRKASVCPHCGTAV